MEKKGTHFSFNTARAPYIKHDSAEVKEVVDFAERIRCMLELKINKLRTVMQKSDNHYDADMAMIRIQALEWVQGRIQDLILNNVTTDWPLYNDEEVF
ncbi:MAG: hypothetical protein ACJ72R_04685 [Nitrososphaeraceae archaeon]